VVVLVIVSRSQRCAASSSRRGCQDIAQLNGPISLGAGMTVVLPGDACRIAKLLGRVAISEVPGTAAAAAAW
jgi:hypothetical protein